MTTSTRFFVGIGAAKAGTSWLPRPTAAPPEVGVAKADAGASAPIQSTTEWHYFDSAFNNRVGGSFGRQLVRLARLAIHDGDEECLERALAQMTLAFSSPEEYRRELAKRGGPGVQVVGEVTTAYVASRGVRSR